MGVGGGGVTARQDYFTSFEPRQSLVGTKTEKNHLNTRKQILARTHGGEMIERFRALKISRLNHLATGAAN